MSVSARFWRVRFWANTGAGDIWLDELSFLGPTDAVIPPSGIPISSGDYGAGYDRFALFDGVIGSGNGWASSSIPCWVGMDFGASVEVGAVRIWCSWQFSAYDELPVEGAMALEYSNDGTAWLNYPTSLRSGVIQVGSAFELGAALPTEDMRLSRVGVQPLSAVPAFDMRKVGEIVSQDLMFGGLGEFPFQVEGLDGSQKARVTLLRAKDKSLVQQCWSAADGKGKFTGLDMQTKFIALAESQDGAMHPVAASHYPKLPEAT